MRDIRITISLSGEELKELEDRMFSGRHRSLSSYIRGVLFPGQGESAGLGTISNPKVIEVPETQGPKPSDKVDEFLYEDLIGRISKGFEYELDYEQKTQLNRDIKASGLVWNDYKKRLEKVVDGQFKLIKQF